MTSLTRPAEAGESVGVLSVDQRALVSRADLVYDNPAGRSEEGLPVGNGRMGSLVWTTPTAMKLQINRVDVFASNCATNSFPQRNTDYCGGCGFVDIEFPEFGDAVFPIDGAKHRLSCYEGLVAVQGKGVELQTLTWHEQDVMAIRVTDRREKPGTISVNLRMLRAPIVRTASHAATSKLETRDGRIVLTQAFAEDEYHCDSAVAIGIAGRKAQVRQASDTEIRLVVEQGTGAFTIFIASAATFDPRQDIAASALNQLEAAASRGYAGLLESNRTWWRQFWDRSFVHLRSDDGVADRIEQNYTYYLYVMASCSRGKYPAKFNGMLWITGGDKRQWGGHFWGANQSCIYNPALLAANHIELLDPMFDMYSGMFDACSLAARQQWGSQGVFIPETVAFDGLAALPDDIAAEMSELYLLQKPWETRSARFLQFAGTRQPHSSRWNWMGGGQWTDGRWVPTERGGGPYGPVTHIFSRGAKIAYLYWLRYEYTLDDAWLGNRAYPMLKGVAEFYRNYPNLKKGADGKYHIHHVNSNEPLWGGQDTDEEIASMMGVLPVAIKASQILNVDAQLRPAWQDLLTNLAPLPRSDHPAASSTRPGAPVWIKSLPPAVKGAPTGLPDGNTMPMWCFDLCTLESDAQTLATANATLDAHFRGAITPDRRIGVLSMLGIAAASLGRADAVHHLIPNQIQSREAPVLANRMDLREGAQTTSIQRLGRAADALHNALCQSVPAVPGQPPVIRVFPAWPTEWDAAFRLRARGGFLISSAMRNGRIEFVEIESEAGGTCTMRNPWPLAAVTVRMGAKEQELSGPLLKFPTVWAAVVRMFPKGQPPAPWALP